MASLDQLIATYLVLIGPTGAPNGEIYARVMEHGLGLEVHQKFIAELCRQGVAHQAGHFVTLTDKGQRLRLSITKVLLEAEATKSKPQPTAHER